MRGITCSRCCSWIRAPFTAQVFKNDGSEYVVKNAIPEGVEDGNGSVIVYLHKDCAKQSRFYARIPAGATEKRIRSFREKSTASLIDELRGCGYFVSAEDRRILMVMPRLMANEVKRL